MTNSIATNQTILVVGGGIGGMTAALEAAECGKQVILVERNATLGGRTALMNRYFPKMCHPTCGLEINLRRLKGNRNVRVMTLAEVSSVTGQRGDYTVTLKLSPRYQANVEIYQSEINKKQGTKLAMPVVYYSQLMTVAYGGSLKQAGLNGHVIQPEKLKQIASRQK